jgi:antitoxin CptB
VIIELQGRLTNVNINDTSVTPQGAGERQPEFSDVDLKRMYWHSRRGMLELDLLLVPFATDRLRQLAHAEIVDYRNLLEEEDQDLWLWLTRREPAPTEALRRSIDLVLRHNAEAGKA